MTGAVIERCYVYRFYAADDRLLYVGITRDTRRRFADHERGARWWPDVARWEVRVLPNRAVAEVAEALAIATEHPVFNALRPTTAVVHELARTTSREETKQQVRAVAEVERLRRLCGEQHVRIVRLQCDNSALNAALSVLGERLRWARADVRESDALLARLRAALTTLEAATIR